ncbi:unnamed protein product [Didymodactylos carnosus]|uniref:Uncharacterized protein n=1 Tax=Didymodactylos carnosus TaxID=1234261 RepID=A0A814XYI4_9BILA|nr:unnamed protein product [Didymodactylos carnosus]CAF1362671.1 unnamed protein product [Didymodactylos carnosus]CAF3985341.1 unnamed protein product [Didymodactylos carnosus]CAF4172500.1 unnamed protein product [Didymodactylos carnosus]
MKLLGVVVFIIVHLVNSVPIPCETPISNKLTPFFLQQVHLVDSVHSPSLAGQQLNQAYLDILPVDRLLYTYYRNANLSVEGIEPLGGWESPESDIRGVFLAFYLQASVKAYLAYNNTRQLAKAQQLVEQLSRVQKILNDSGFLAAWPSENLRKLERLEKVWAPIYCYEKLLRGLSDMYTFTGMTLAGSMMHDMLDYLYTWMVHCANTYPASHWHTMIFSTTDYEYGGISEFLYEQYGLTRDERFFWMAQQFDDGQFLGALSLNADFLQGIHANSHVPPVLGSGRRYSITGEQQYRAILENFFSLVWNNHTYSTGGSNGGNGSVGFYQQEHYSDPNRLSQTLWNNNQEFCVQYNMLKVIRVLIEWTGQVEFMNAYERVFVNSIWGTQDPSGPGHMLYSYPLGEGVSKPTAVSSGGIGYGSQFDSFWCCYTTAIDQWTKMSDSIYFFQVENEASSLYVNLFVASQLDWQAHDNLSIRQTTTFPRETTTVLTVATILDAVPFRIYLRVPSWIVANESWIEINGVRQQMTLTPSTYALLASTSWKNNDRIVYNMAMQLHVEPINDNPQLVSILFGPIVLGGLINKAKTLSRDVTSIRQVNTTAYEPLQFEATALDGSTFRLLPLYEIVNQTYTVYFPLE